MRLIALLLCFLGARPVWAMDDPSAICDAVALEASRHSGVPVSVLKAIQLTETGRKREGRFRPWPWTINLEGKGTWFDSPQEMAAYAQEAVKANRTSFDVGCFQINYKYHGDQFASLEQMFDPLANALYAAKFLTDLYREKGDWTKAAGAYHSRTSEKAERYAARFEGFRKRLEGEDGASGWTGNYASAGAPDLPLGPGVGAGGDIPTIPDIVAANAPAPPPPRVNTYPLLVAGAQSGALGSLVPVSAQGGASLFPQAPTVRDE